MKNIIKNIYRQIRNVLWLIFRKKKAISRLNSMIENNRLKNKETSTYYIISCEKMPQQGLFGYVGLMLAMIWYAIELDMIPVIDMKNSPNTYLERDEVGKINALELFFQRITEKSLDDIYENCNYVIGNHKDINWSYLPGINGYHKKSLFYFLTTMYSQYLILSLEAEKYCSQEFKTLLEGHEKETLGVLIRGTDIKTCKGHALQPSLEQVCDKIKEILKKDGNFKYIYLATEEKASEDFLQERFPNMIIVNQRTYYDSSEYQKLGGLSYVTTQRTRDRYSRGIEYLSSMYLLSKCGGLISGQCGGGFAAYYMNGGRYRYSYFWELGVVE